MRQSSLEGTRRRELKVNLNIKLKLKNVYRTLKFLTVLIRFHLLKLTDQRGLSMDLVEIRLHLPTTCKCLAIDGKRRERPLDWGLWKIVQF